MEGLKAVYIEARLSRHEGPSLRGRCAKVVKLGYRSASLGWWCGPDGGRVEVTFEQRASRRLKVNRKSAAKIPMFVGFPIFSLTTRLFLGRSHLWCGAHFYGAVGPLIEKYVWHRKGPCDPPTLWHAMCLMFGEMVGDRPDGRVWAARPGSEQQPSLK
jgi:hypothetical protein